MCHNETAWQTNHEFGLCGVVNEPCFESVNASSYPLEMEVSPVIRLVKQEAVDGCRRA
jgi:hypothetical protein